MRLVRFMSWLLLASASSAVPLTPPSATATADIRIPVGSSTLSSASTVQPSNTATENDANTAANAAVTATEIASVSTPTEACQPGVNGLTNPGFESSGTSPAPWKDNGGGEVRPAGNNPAAEQGSNYFLMLVPIKGLPPAMAGPSHSTLSQTASVCGTGAYTVSFYYFQLGGGCNTNIYIDGELAGSVGGAISSNAWEHTAFTYNAADKPLGLSDVTLTLATTALTTINDCSGVAVDNFSLK